MSQTIAQTLLPDFIRRRPGVTITAVIVTGLGVWFALAIAPRMDWGEPVRLHGPDWALLAAQPLMVRAHVGAATLTFVLGLLMFVRVKGDRWHKLLGWTWVGAMFATAASSLFIMQLNHGMFSLIHLISGWTLVALPAAVYAARRRNIKAHRRAMTSLFAGGMLIAGGFTFLPGRLMWRLFFG